MFLYSHCVSLSPTSEFYFKTTVNPDAFLRHPPSLLLDFEVITVSTVLCFSPSYHEAHEQALTFLCRTVVPLPRPASQGLAPILPRLSQKGQRSPW